MAQAKFIPIRETLRKLFPPSFLMMLAKTTGAVKRIRQVSPTDLFWTLVLGFGVGQVRTIAGLRRTYEKATGQTIEESSFYDRLNEGLARMLKGAVAHALKTSLGVGRALSRTSSCTQSPHHARRGMYLTRCRVGREPGCHNSVEHIVQLGV